MFRKPTQLISIESIRETVSKKVVTSSKKEKTSVEKPIEEEMPVKVASPLTFRKQEDKLPKVDESIKEEKKLKGDHILWIQ
jgi:hypothetical protein